MTTTAVTPTRRPTDLRLRRRPRTAAPSVRRRLRLTGRGRWLAGIAGTALGFGTWARYGGLIALGLGLAAAVLISLLGLLTSRRLAVHRMVPAKPIPRLTELNTALRFATNTGDGLREFTAEERIAGVAHPIAEQTLKAGAAVTVELPVDTTLPGVVEVGPFTLRQLGFAGLTRMTWSDGSREEITVVARTLPVDLPAAGAVPQDATQPDRHEGGGTELRSLRNYIAGDDIRKVNARISARMGTLMIRQDAEPAIMSLRVLIDNRADLPPLAYAEMLDVATSICTAAALDGLPVSWSGRGRGETYPVEVPSIGAATIGIGCLARTDEPLPRSPSGDLTLLITGPGADLPELISSVAAHGDHRTLVALVVDEDEGGPLGTAVVLRAPSAEMCLRRFGQYGASLGGSR